MFPKGLLVTLVVLSLASVSLAAKVEIVPLPAPQGLQDLPVAPWVASADKWWDGRKPTFSVGEEGAEFRADGWVAVSNDAILLHFVVHDPVHLNTRTGGSLWEQDSIQFGLDAYGEGAGGLPKETGMVGPHDASVDFALTDKGPAISVTAIGKSEGSVTEVAPMPIVRDEQAKTTTYDLTFPWKLLNARPGISPVLGLAVRFNNVNGPKDKQTRLEYGQGVGGTIRPGQFKKIAIGNPSGEFVSLDATKTEIWRAGQCGEVTLAVASDAAVTVRGALADKSPTGDELVAGPLRAPVAGGIQRFIIRGCLDALPADPATLNVQVKKDGEVVAETSAQLTAPALVVQKLQDRVAQLVRQSTNDLVIRNLRSIEGEVLADWARSSAVLESAPQVAQMSVENAQNILNRLTDDCADWSMYTSRQKRLILSYISPRDGTLQMYRLTLPEGWESGKKYPMIVFLHGAGDPHPLHFAGRGMELQFDPDAKKYYEKLDPTAAGAYILEPSARGNSGYRDIGETDVWEAIADAGKTVAVDENRMYLSGFSMGAFGTWGLSMRTPDKWAAIAICAGGMRSAPIPGIAANVSYLPVTLYQGEVDGTVNVSSVNEMQAELKKAGNDPRMIVRPNVGHSVSQDDRNDIFAWMLTHTRQRPAEFSFMADTAEHPGVWGITMKRDLTVSALPKFTCRIEGNTVHIASQGTPQLTVELGEGGLGLTGDVEVLWNDQKAYSGPAKKITLGEKDKK